MKKSIFAIAVGAICLLLTACADHDDPKLAPIDTSKVKTYDQTSFHGAWENVAMSTTNILYIFSVTETE